MELLKSRGVKMGTPKSRRYTEPIVLALVNNVFRVDDSLAYMRDGRWKSHPFAEKDPTGESEVLADAKETLGDEARLLIKTYLTRYPEDAHGTAK